ncbi:MAG: YicC family protein [Candidatus Krumholzibacteriota bacterium]|nr:YicC family protein [Candidatus Krumholzibacteriota bacterium]
MITSMTGYGRGEATSKAGRVAAEIRTVNHRFIDFSIRMPRPLSGYETEVEKLLRRKLGRGHVYVNVSVDRGTEAAAAGIDRAFLRRAFRELQAFAKREKIPGTVDINTLLSLPDAFSNGPESAPPTALWRIARKALDEAADRCVEMRRREGAALEADIARRLKGIGKTAARIEKNAPAALAAAVERARRRLAQIVENQEIDEQRWATEAAIMADRADFSEEIVRLKSHLEQFGHVLSTGGEVAKKLTFLLQEIHREATTMGNKATEAAIIRDAINVKEAVEKIREQVQNLE